MAAPSSGTGVLRLFVYLGCLSMATAYGIFFTLPLYIKALGGDESVVGNILLAGAFGTLGCVGFANQLLKAFSLNLCVVVGALLYAVGAAIFAFVEGISPIYYLGGFLLGAGWGLTFTIAPIMLSSLVTDENRAVFFSVMSAFYAIGMGLAPVASRQALLLDIPQWRLFAFAMVAALAAAVLFNLAALRLHQIPKRSLALSGGEKRALRLIFGSGAKYPLIMVFLGACIFSTMTNFQTTFAISRGLNFSVFFIWYTIAVIGARFLLSGSVSRRDPIKMTMALLATMCMALGLLMITRTDLLYAVSALILGLSYGLVYPLIQAQAVNESDERVRSKTLGYFSLSYFLGVYGFPKVGAYIIVNSGYQALLVTLLALAAAELAVAVWRYFASRPALLETGRPS